MANPWFNGAGTNLPKLLVSTGLAPSRTEAERLLKAGAVEIDGGQVGPAKLPGQKLYRAGGEEVEASGVAARLRFVRGHDSAPVNPVSPRQHQPDRLRVDPVLFL